MFNEGDIVKTQQGEIGVVGWNENKYMNLTVEDGCLGVSLKTGSKGFLSPVKADTCTKSSLDELLSVLEKEKEELQSSLRKCNFNQELFNKTLEENKLLKQLLALHLSE